MPGRVAGSAGVDALKELIESRYDDGRVGMLKRNDFDLDFRFFGILNDQLDQIFDKLRVRGAVRADHDGPEFRQGIGGEGPPGKRHTWAGSRRRLLFLFFKSARWSLFVVRRPVITGRDT